MTDKTEHPERDRQMTEFAVCHDGLCYRYNGYRPDKWQAVAHASLPRFDEGAYRFRDFRYDRLPDAVNYAKRDPPRHEE